MIQNRNVIRRAYQVGDIDRAEYKSRMKGFSRNWSEYEIQQAIIRRRTAKSWGIKAIKRLIVEGVGAAKKKIGK